ncbi:MAG: tRNA pseudouridine(55) synthase TruB [Legionella sp.]|nr:MAG: tRNA pseudouridine(55) synthase TruB [Legionella sp.]
MSKADLKPLNGILLLNKSQGMTSNSALQKAKYLFGAKKAGHTGSLDPLATGMLPVCFGEATKISQFLLDADKCYSTTGLLGIKTNTADSMGEVIATASSVDVSLDELQEILTKYHGHIKQIPSMFSALKHQGRPLYRFARAGIEITREARDVAISELELERFDGQLFDLRVRCSKGTYIRNLVEDIGEDLKVGAHVTRLHRLYTAGFENNPMYTLEELLNMSAEQRLQVLIPMDKAVDYLPYHSLATEEVLALRQGRVISGQSSYDIGTCIRLYDAEKQFIGLGEYVNQAEIRAKRLLAFELTSQFELSES